MTITIILACVVVCILILIMFLILKKTVKVINSQAKTYFVDKLQVYDDLIDEKEKKLNEINELLKNKEENYKEKNNYDNNNYNFDCNIIDLFNSAEYQDEELLRITKLITEKFDFNHELLIKKFLSSIKDTDKYEFCLNLKNKFTNEVIYEIETLLDNDVDDYMNNLLKKEEYDVYLLFKDLNEKFNINDFIDYLDRLVNLNDPTITIYVSSKKENYDNLSKYIKTVVSDDIYSGIRIVYKDKVYDFSLSERNA